MVNKSTFHKLQFILLAVIIVLGLVFMFERSSYTSLPELFVSEYKVIHIGEVPVHVEVADTPEERSLGLSGRSEIGDAEALLFVFDEPGYHGIWMKDMKFAIDILWIDENNEVIEITRNVTPDTYPRIFEPKRPAKYVLETEVLFSETFGFSAGNTVRFPVGFFK